MAVPVAVGAGSVRSLHIREGGVLRTSPSTEIPVNSDTTFRVMLRRNEWDLGRRTVMALTDGQNNRLSIGYNLSPWIIPSFSNGSPVNPFRAGEELSIIFGCPTGQIYEDWWVVYKAPGPAGGEDGYLRVYRNGAPAPLDTDGTEAVTYFPAGTALHWQGGPVYLMLGDDASGPRQDYHLIDVAWWTEALSAADIAAIGHRQIASIPDDAVRHLSTLYWYARPGNAQADRVVPELGAAVGKAHLEAVMSGGVSFSTDVPAFAGWEAPDDLTPPDPGSNPLSATPEGTGIRVTMGPGSEDTTLRELVLSRGIVHRYTTVARRPVSEPGATVTQDFTELTPGKHYYVTGRWLDRHGNATERQVEVVTNGEESVDTRPTRSLRIRRDGVAQTVADGATPEREFVEMPFNVDSATFRMVVRRNAGFTGPAWFWSSRADKASVYGYARFAVGQTRDGYLLGKATNGEKTFTVESPDPLPVGSFREVWMTYVAPSPASAGSLSLYWVSGKTLAQIASTVIPPMDFTWRKWDATFVLGGLQDGQPNATIDYNLLETAFWTRALDQAEMQRLVGRGLDFTTFDERVGGHLYWYARPHQEVDRVEPDRGASINTAPLRPESELVGASGVIEPQIPAAMAGLVTFSDEVPASYTVNVPPPYTVDDATRALALAAGLESASAADLDRLDVETETSPGSVTTHDAALLLRKSSGLETVL